MKNKQTDNKKFSAKYVSRFLNLNSCENLAPFFKSNNPTKEIQESFSFFYAVTEKLQLWDKELDTQKNDVTVIVLGDGKRPRTGALFAYLTKWNVISCDPIMTFDLQAANLKLFDCVAEDILFESLESQGLIKDKILLLYPHSHVKDTNKIYQKLKHKKIWQLTLPCCIEGQDNNLPLQCYTYRDIYIDSPKNLMKIYCNFMDLAFKVI